MKRSRIRKFIPAREKECIAIPDDKIIGGVCSGLGAYLDNDPVLFRILFVLFALFFGVGFFIYIVLWIALPEAKTDARKREMYGKAYHSARSLTFSLMAHIAQHLHLILQAIIIPQKSAMLSMKFSGQSAVCVLLSSVSS